VSTLSAIVLSVCAVVFLAGLFMLALCNAASPASELERQREDEEQAEYLRQWQERKARKGS